MIRAVLRLLARTLAALLLLAVLGTLAVAARVWWVGTQDEHTPADALVVLGAAQFDGRPSPVFRARLDHARMLYDDGIAPRIVTVGGSLPGDRFTEAAAGQDYLVGAGVPADAVLAVEEGSDTEQSIAAVAAAMRGAGWDSAVVVTDPWHALRSRSMARDAGLSAVTSPTPDGPTWQPGTAARYVARETAAYLWYELVGGSVDGAPPAV